MKPFSVVIPTRDNARMKFGSLWATLECLERSAEVIEEVVVVDNGSTDGAIALRPGGWRNRLVITSFDREPHIAAARNLGVRYSQAPFAVFIDDDMMVPEDSLERLAGQVHESAFWTCAERRYLPWGTPMAEIRAAARRHDANWFRHHSTDVPGSQALEQRFQVLYRPTFIGCFGIVPRRLFDRVGGFDEQFSGWGGEDTDLLARLLEVAPLVSLFTEHVAYHYDHLISPYKLMDRTKASDRLGKKLRAKGQDFDIVRFSEAVVRGEDVSHWDLSLAHQQHPAPSR